MGWLEERCRQSGHKLMPLYGINGRAHITETELSHLSGYRGSPREARQRGPYPAPA